MKQKSDWKRITLLRKTSFEKEIKNIGRLLPTIRPESARSRSGTQSLGVKLHLRPPAIDLAQWQTYHFRWWLLAPNL